MPGKVGRRPRNLEIIGRNKSAIRRPGTEYAGRRTFKESEEKETFSEGIYEGTKTATEVWKYEIKWLQGSAFLHGPDAKLY